MTDERVGMDASELGARQRLVRVALGQEEADLLIRGATVVNVLTRELYEADVAIASGRIAAVGGGYRAAEVLETSRLPAVMIARPSVPIVPVPSVPVPWASSTMSTVLRRSGWLSVMISVHGCGKRY